MIEFSDPTGRLPVHLERWRPGNHELTPLELSSSCHREAKHLEERRVSDIGGDGAHNILIDTTLSSEEVGRTWVRRLRKLGYDHVVCMLPEVPRPEAYQRCLKRWQHGVLDYFDGTGLGGRYISSSNFDGYFRARGLNPTCFQAYERLRDLGPPDGFDAARRYRSFVRNGVLRFQQVQ